MLDRLADGIKKLLPIADTRLFGHPSLPSDHGFGEPTAESIFALIFQPLTFK